MILFPAIDLKDGKCVRLLRGDFDQATVFSDDPAAQARKFANAGCEWLHLVDLNGAVAGQPVNDQAVRAILAAIKVPAQLGGGIRDLDTMTRWLDAGLARIILGTVAVKNPELVKRACARWPGRIVIGIDARDGLVAVDGWTKTSSIKALDLALRLEEAGAAAIVYTDIDRDGAMGGVNVEATVDLAYHLSTPVIASGGVSSMQDLEEIKQFEKAGIVGVICGRALYDGRVELAKAIALLKRPAPGAAAC